MDYIRTVNRHIPSPIRWLQNQLDQERILDAKYREKGMELCLAGHPEINNGMRYKIVDWMHEIQSEYRKSKQVFWVAIGLFDVYLKKERASVEPVFLQIIGAVCFWIAVKNEEGYTRPYACDILMLTGMSGRTGTERAQLHRTLLELESHVIKVINFELILPSCMAFLDQFFMMIMRDRPKVYHVMASFLLDLTALDVRLNKYTPAEKAAAAIYTLRLIVGEKAWCKEFNDKTEVVETRTYGCALNIVHQIMRQGRRPTHIYLLFDTEETFWVARRALWRAAKLLRVPVPERDEQYMLNGYDEQVVVDSPKESSVDSQDTEVKLPQKLNNFMNTWYDEEYAVKQSGELSIDSALGAAADETRHVDEGVFLNKVITSDSPGEKENSTAERSQRLKQKNMHSKKPVIESKHGDAQEASSSQSSSIVSSRYMVSPHFTGATEKDEKEEENATPWSSPLDYAAEAVCDPEEQVEEKKCLPSETQYVPASLSWQHRTCSGEKTKHRSTISKLEKRNSCPASFSERVSRTERADVSPEPGSLKATAAVPCAQTQRRRLGRKFSCEQPDTSASRKCARLSSEESPPSFGAPPGLSALCRDLVDAPPGYGKSQAHHPPPRPEHKIWSSELEDESSSSADVEAKEHGRHCAEQDCVGPPLDDDDDLASTDLEHTMCEENDELAADAASRVQMGSGDTILGDQCAYEWSVTPCDLEFSSPLDFFPSQGS